MDISDLLFSQKNGVFLVWKMHDGKAITTFLRNRMNISLEVQIENAVADGRSKMWTLIGIGHWHLRPVHTENSTTENMGGLTFNISTVTASLLRLKKLPEREHKSTELGIQEMRERWIPDICAQLRKILGESEL